MAALPSSPARASRGAVARADLLEALQRCELDWFALPDPASVGPQGPAGYERQLRSLSPEPPPEDPQPPTDDAPAEAPRRPPLRAPRMWVVTDVQQPEAQASADEPGPILLNAAAQDRPPAAAATTVVLQHRADEAALERRRFTARLQASFSQGDAASPRLPVDWPAAVRRLSRGQPLWPLPRRRVQRLPANLLVVLDRAAGSLTPFVNDMDDVAARCRRALGGPGVRVRVLGQGPAEPHRPWWKDRSSQPSAADRPQPWRPLFGGWLLLLSDLGVAPASADRAAQFAPWLRAMLHGGTRLAVLSPAPARPPFTGLGAMGWQHWGAPGSSDRRRLSTTSAGLGAHTPPAVTTLLALVHLAGAATDDLLRALAALLTAGTVDRGLLWSAWNHAHLQVSGRHCTVRAEHGPAYEAHLATLPLGLLQQAHELRRQFQAAAPVADEHLAVLRACALVPALRGPLAAQHAAARQFIQAGLPAALRGAAGPDAAGVHRQAAMVLALAHPAVLRAQAQDFRHLQSLAFEAALRRGEPVPVYDALGPPTLDDDAGAQGDSGPIWHLVQQGASLRLQMPAPTKGIVLYPRLGPAHAARGVSVTQAGQTRWLPIRMPWQELADLEASDEPIQIQLGAHSVVLQSVQRPAWAAGWTRRQDGLELEVRSPWGALLKLPWQHDGPYLAGHSRGPVHFAYGADEWGVYFDLWLQETLLQRFRYIEPGSFLMGSPAGQGDDDEHPQHPVTITQGFWLADTPCTQAFWMAVMGGDNPSHFKDSRLGEDAAQRPVEQVSWVDVVGYKGRPGFLGRLAALLPEGCTPALPTEAEWEYAARASSTTAYPWGDAMDPQRANTSETGPGRTTPVKQFNAPNAWGLHDLHGNVWEWCADGWQRVYQERPEVDPAGPTDAARRVLRGGSWDDRPAFARSAFRGRKHPDYRWLDAGFRLALRSPGPGGPGYGGGPEARPAAGGGSAPVAEPLGPLARLGQAIRAALGGGGAPRPPASPDGPAPKKRR